MPIEFSDRALRVVGTNYQGIEFYDDDRALRATIYLDENGNLNISTAVVTTTTTEEGAPSALASAPFLVVSADATLLGERVFSPGNGLTGSDGGPGASYSLAVQLQTTSGLSLSASGLALGAPSTLTVATSNAVTASSHTHAITTSSNPGAAAAILATDASGNITLQNLTLAGTTGITASGAGAGLTFSATGAHTIQASHASGTLTVTAGSTVTVSAGGNLVLSPTGDITLDPTGNDILPNTGYDLNLGSLTKKFLTLHAAELWVETLVAQDTIATIGGRVIVAPTTQLIADVTGVASTIDVKHNQMTSGDRVLLQANGKMEWMAITSSPSAITGGYRYSVTRNLEGFDGDTWTAGDAVVNTGQAGSGFIDLYSMESVLGRPLDYIYNYNQTGAVYTGNYSTSSNWTIFGDGANTQTSDAVYFGVAGAAWENLYYYIGTAASYTATLAWEYWSGAAWTSFSPTTTDFKSTGLKSTTWSAASLTGWAANSVNSITAFWVRVRITAFTSWATQPTQVGKRVYRQKSQFGPTIVGWVRNSTTYSDITEAWAIGNLNGLYGYATDDYGLGLGKYGSGLANVTLDATNGLRLRSYTDTILQIKNSDGKGYITGVVYLDTSGGIFQGTGTFASPTTGFKLYNSGGVGLWELWAGGTKQVYSTTGGLLVAGAGNTQLDANGVTITLTTSYSDTRAYRISDGSSVVGRLYGYADAGSGDTIIRLYASPSSSSHDAQAQVVASNTDAARAAKAYLVAVGSGGSSTSLEIRYNNAAASGRGAFLSGSFKESTAIAARAFNSGAISHTSTGNWQALTFDSERFDNDTIHSTSSNTGRLTATTAGVYVITGHISFASNATGVRGIAVRLNGATYIAADLRPANSGVISQLSIAVVYQLSATDYVELMAYQSSGGNLNIDVGGNYTPEFSMARIV